MSNLSGPRRERGDGSTKLGSLTHLWRVLFLSLAYKRYLYPAMTCIVIVAITYSVSILALVPLVQILAKDEGVPFWVHNTISAHRLGIPIDDVGYVLKIDENPDRHIPIERHSRLVELEGRPVHYESRQSPAGEAGSPDSISLAEAFHHIAHWEGDRAVGLAFQPEGGGAKYVVSLPVNPIGKIDRLERYGVQWLPPETTKEARFKTLWYLVWVLFLIAAFGGVCRFFGEYLIALVAARILVSIRRQMYRKVLQLPISHFAQHGTSDLVSRFVQDSQDIYRGLNYVFAKGLREPLKAIFVFGAALILDWRITLMTAVVAPPAAILIRLVGKKIRKANKRLLQGMGRMLGALEGSLSGIRVVKGYTMESYQRRHLYAVDLNMLKQQLKIERAEALMSPAFETIGRFVASGAILYFGWLMFEKHMGFGRFAALATCMAAIFDPIRKMSDFYTRIQRASSAAERVYEVLDLPSEEDHESRSVALPPFAQSIEFRGVTYTYPGTDRPAVEDFNLTVRSGERVAFVGPNGSGKTTVLSLLMRFFLPQKGQILIDGRDIRMHSLASLRRQVSIITQDTIMFADTIAHNIAYGDERLLPRLVLQQRHPERDYHLNGAHERIESAARAAFADEFIREKPAGYDTMIGEHGATLSGGQKQRIAIARAVLRDAPILILDEATSQVDAESEQKIHEAIHRLLENRTAFIIAHRFTTIQQADRIVVMDRGRIESVGVHAELMDKSPLYRSLYGSQIIASE